MPVAIGASRSPTQDFPVRSVKCNTVLMKR